MILSDDMMTRQGIVEGSAATFSNSWKANRMCQDKEDRLDDPCTLSMENGKLETFQSIKCISVIPIICFPRL